MLRFLIDDSVHSCSIDSLQRLLHLPLYNNRTPVVSISQTKSNPEFEDMGYNPER
ncbi:hypothetical protein Hanom_Chr10g00877091 [Helianthus anomalus]